MGVVTGLIQASPSRPMSGLSLRPCLLVVLLSLLSPSLPPSFTASLPLFLFFVRVQTESSEFELVENVWGRGSCRSSLS